MEPECAFIYCFLFFFFLFCNKASERWGSVFSIMETAPCLHQFIYLCDSVLIYARTIFFFETNIAKMQRLELQLLIPAVVV